MKTRLIPASTTFIATIGHTPRIALKTVRMTQATVLSTRRRRMRAWSREKTSSAEPNQPRASTQVTPAPGRTGHAPTPRRSTRRPRRGDRAAEAAAIRSFGAGPAAAPSTSRTERTSPRGRPARAAYCSARARASANAASLARASSGAGSATSRPTESTARASPAASARAVTTSPTRARSRTSRRSAWWARYPTTCWPSRSQRGATPMPVVRRSASADTVVRGGGQRALEPGGEGGEGRRHVVPLDLHPHVEHDDVGGRHRPTRCR